MRIDPALLRAMLEAIEQSPDAEIFRMPDIPPYAADVQRQHLQQLIDRGYVTATQLLPYRPAVAIGLTISGQQFLDTLRRSPSWPIPIGDVTRRVVASVAIAVILAKAKALGVDVGSG